MENTLSQFERATLWNQLEILKVLQPEKSATFAMQQEILESGLSTQYWELTGHISAKEHGTEMQGEVLDIMNMFRALSIAKRGGWAPQDTSASTFRGFEEEDHNGHFAFSQFLLDTKGLFAESKNCPRNSQDNTVLEAYRKMLKKWKLATNQFELSQEDADHIVS